VYYHLLFFHTTMVNTTEKLVLDEASLGKSMEMLKKENKALNESHVAMLRKALATLDPMTKKELQKQFGGGDAKDALANFDMDNAADRKALLRCFPAVDTEDEDHVMYEHTELQSKEMQDIYAILKGVFKELDTIEASNATAVSGVVKNTAQETFGLLSDINSNGTVSDLKNKNKEARTSARNESLEDKQKDMLSAIDELTTLSSEQKDIVISLAQSGDYRNAKQMKSAYIDSRIDGKGDKNQKKADSAKAAGEWKAIEEALKTAGLYDDLSKAAKMERRSNRTEARHARAFKNKEENNVSERTLGNVMHQLVMMYGGDAAAKDIVATKLNAKLQKSAGATMGADAAK
jgi:hypothetical protein